MTADANAATACAKKIYAVFADYQSRFQKLTRRASKRFARRQWSQMQSDALERLDLYPHCLDTITAALGIFLGAHREDKLLWEEIKTDYARLIDDSDAPELARTFFNSVTRRIFTTVGVDARIEFPSADFESQDRSMGSPVFRSYTLVEPIGPVLERILSDYGFDHASVVKSVTMPSVAASIKQALAASPGTQDSFRLEMYGEIFYRGQGAYLIGRLVSTTHSTGVVLALLHPPAGIIVDAVLIGVTPIRILFSFTRSAFHVLTHRPAAAVQFLNSILESKPEAEVYSALGFYKHGKTLLYRDLRQHTRECTADRFEISAGQRGMVMIVFDMANDDMVLKLIRDHFQKPKNTTRRKVMAQYDFVFKHYRVGRLIEAQPFEYLSFDICWFTDELLEELTREAARTVRIEKDRVIIRHAYVERRVTPLDLYLRQAPPEKAARVVIDFGHAIKDLAFSNIFPGDLLLKNFGVTRHDRVVFYDYDEIVPLTDCTFRRVPPPRNHMQEMAAEPWYYVAENDVFPEEHARFLGLTPELKVLFMEHHQDLFHPDFWQQVQADIRAGKIKHIRPYAQAYRVQSD